RRRHTRSDRDWSSDVCSSDLSDQPAADGTIYDVDRIMYLRNYLAQLQRATSEGVPVLGYFLWTLMDNFEWSDGYEQRFGLYHVRSEERRVGKRGEQGRWSVNI